MTTKAFGHVDVALKAVDDDGDGPGSFEWVLSTDSLDRDGEIIDVGAFDPLPKRITIDVDHGMSVATTVGSGVPAYEDGRLVVRGSFSSIPRAQEVRTLVKEGHIDSMSVAFMNARVETDDADQRPHIRSAELLNGAIVAIPSNRDALLLAAKAAQGVTQDPPAADPDTAGDDPAAKAADESPAVRQLGPELEAKTVLALAEAELIFRNERG